MTPNSITTKHKLLARQQDRAGPVSKSKGVHKRAPPSVCKPVLSAELWFLLGKEIQMYKPKIYTKEQEKSDQ